MKKMAIAVLGNVIAIVIYMAIMSLISVGVLIISPILIPMVIVKELQKSRPTE